MLYGLIGQIVTKRPELSQHLYGNLERLNKMQENLEAAQRSEGIFEETPEMSAFMLDIFCTLIRAPGLGTMFCVIEGFGDYDRSGSVYSPLSGAIMDYFNDRYLPRRLAGNFMLLIVSRTLSRLPHRCTEIRLYSKQAVEDTETLLPEHETEYTSSCDGSDKEVKHPYSLFQRIDSHHKERGARFAPKSFFQSHMRSRHAESRSRLAPYICSICSKIFARRTDHLTHMLYAHNHTKSITYGAKRQELSSQPRDDTNNNLKVSDDNFDQASPTSRVESILSLASMSSTATGKQQEDEGRDEEENEAEESKDDDREKVHSLNRMPDLVPEVYLPMESGEAFIKKRYHRTLFSQIQVALDNLFIAAGFLEPPLEPGMVRVRWICVGSYRRWVQIYKRLLIKYQRCGESFFGDVMEYRHNGIHELTDRMNRSTGASITVASYSKTSKNQNWNFKFPAWARRGTGTSSVKATTPNSGGGLPQYNAPDRSAPLTSSAPATNTPTNSTPRLHLLACAHRTERRKCLLQDPIDSVSTDRALFCFMKQQIRCNNSRFRSILAMRSIQGMFFVKVSLE